MPKKSQKNPLVWSLTVRLTHWLVALGVVTDLVNETGFTHRMIGYGCLLLVLWRIGHGLGANTPAGSGFYWPGPTAILQHIRAIKARNIPTHAGHNPLGQWAAYLIWTLIALLAFSGWLSRTDAYWGEDWPVDWHQYLAYALMGLLALHVLAAVLMSIISRKNLIKQMCTGKKDAS